MQPATCAAHRSPWRSTPRLPSAPISAHGAARRGPTPRTCVGERPRSGACSTAAWPKLAGGCGATRSACKASAEASEAAADAAAKGGPAAGEDPARLRFSTGTPQYGARQRVALQGRTEGWNLPRGQALPSPCLPAHLAPCGLPMHLAAPGEARSESEIPEVPGRKKNKRRPVDGPSGLPWHPGPSHPPPSGSNCTRRPPRKGSGATAPSGISQTSGPLRGRLSSAS